MDVRAPPPSPAPSVVATSSTTVPLIVMKPTLGLALARRSFLIVIIGLGMGRGGGVRFVVGKRSGGRRSLKSCGGLPRLHNVHLTHHFGVSGRDEI